MNGPLPQSQLESSVALPAELEPLLPPPLLLPGEKLDQYLTLRNAILAELAPRSAIEWLLAIDIAEAAWEIQRYRLLRHSLLSIHRQKAIEVALRRIDVRDTGPDSQATAERHTEENALSWRRDPIARHEIEARLLDYGFDQSSINTDVYVQARETFVLFEGLLNGAQLKRMVLLKELKQYRTDTSRTFCAAGTSTSRAFPA